MPEKGSSRWDGKEEKEARQVKALVDYLTVLDGREYVLGPRLDRDRRGPAPDFALLDKTGALVGVVEVTSSAEYQKPRTSTDDFEYEAFFALAQERIKDLSATISCKWEYALEVPWPCPSFLTTELWERFWEALRQAVDELELEAQQYDEENRVNRTVFLVDINSIRFEFALNREAFLGDRIGTPRIRPFKAARVVSSPDSEGLKRAVEHINRKFEEYQPPNGRMPIRLGLIDVFNWPAAEDANQKAFIELKLGSPRIDKLFLITIAPSFSTRRDLKGWKKFGRYLLLKVW